MQADANYLHCTRVHTKLEINCNVLCTYCFKNSSRINCVAKKCTIFAYERASKQYTTAFAVAASTMLGRNKQEIFNYRSGGGAGTGPQYWRYGCGSYSLRDTQLKYK